MGHYAPLDTIKNGDTLHEAYLRPKNGEWIVMGKWNFSIVDFDNESSTVGVRWFDLSAGNITAQLALIATLRTALEAVIIGTPRKETIIATDEDIAGALPANAFAQREVKWLVSGHDSAGLSATLEIPTADLDLLAGGTGALDITAGPGLALANALNAGWRSRAGNLVTVETIVHVGRNI